MEYTTELLNLLNVLGVLVELEPAQMALLDRICAGPMVTESDLKAAGAFAPAGHAPAGATAPDAAQGRLDL